MVGAAPDTVAPDRQYFVAHTRRHSAARNRLHSAAAGARTDCSQRGHWIGSNRGPGWTVSSMEIDLIGSSMEIGQQCHRPPGTDQNPWDSEELDTVALPAGPGELDKTARRSCSIAVAAGSRPAAHRPGRECRYPCALPS